MISFVYIIVGSYSVQMIAWTFSERKESGVYMIFPKGAGGFKVYCDMKTDGCGWTILYNPISFLMQAIK